MTKYVFGIVSVCTVALLVCLSWAQPAQAELEIKTDTVAYYARPYGRVYVAPRAVVREPRVVVRPEVVRPEVVVPPVVAPEVVVPPRAVDPRVRYRETIRRVERRRAREARY